jgi:hypothetical protein
VKRRIPFINLPFLAVFLVLASTAALASSIWYVDGVNGSDNNNCKTPQTACKTIGHAISLASSGDSIRVAAATYTENLTIGFSLKVIGSGATTTIVDGGGVNTVVAIPNATPRVTLAGVTIRNGSGFDGGGVSNNGTLTINNSNLFHNSSKRSGGAIFNGGGMTINKTTISRNSTVGDGGGIWNLGTLTINDSTISRNTGGEILFSTGGGIANSATMTINNSTISGNTVVRHGLGGIENLEGTLTISNSTISANEGGINVNLGMATLQNSIVANNSEGNCFGFAVTSNGYNLSSDGTCNFSNSGDLNNTDPKLGQLGNYGGPTQTVPLLAGSPAIDSGNPGGCTDGNGHLLKTDQRGRPRPDHEDTGGCDMGAYERQTD